MLRQALEKTAIHQQKGMTFVRGNGTERHVPYAKLWENALKYAQGFADRGLRKGDRVALAIPDADEFVLSFFGALLMGGVPVPVYPPASLARLDHYLDNLRRVLKTSGAKVLVSGEKTFAEDAPLGGVTLVKSSTLDGGDMFDPDSVRIGPSDLAFLQFTSGSTSDPKGVCVTHGNLEANGRAIMVDGLRTDKDVDRGLSWLPLYHDMGLIGFVVAPIFGEVPVMLMPTSSFIRRPSQWLDAVNRYRATISFAPNFALALAVRGISERQLSSWDLSCLRVLGCGAEPIDPKTVRAFVDKFAPAKLNPASIFPCYGLAEATLAVAFPTLGRGMRVDRCDSAMIPLGRAEPAVDGRASTEFVACGAQFPNHLIEILSEEPDEQAREGAELRRLGDREIGEITVTGPSVAAGYFGNEEASRASFRDGRLFTGDLGYMAEGDLFVCGRRKDVIIVRGRNYYPQDIEKVISDVEGVREAQVAVFSCPATEASAKDGATERLVAVAEKGGARNGGGDLRTAIATAVLERGGLRLDEIVLIARGTLPKTSSGKVRRQETKARLLAGTLDTKSSDEG